MEWRLPNPDIGSGLELEGTRSCQGRSRRNEFRRAAVPRNALPRIQQSRGPSRLNSFHRWKQWRMKAMAAGLEENLIEEAVVEPVSSLERFVLPFRNYQSQEPLHQLSRRHSSREQRRGVYLAWRQRWRTEAAAGGGSSRRLPATGPTAGAAERPPAPSPPIPDRWIPECFRGRPGCRRSTDWTLHRRRTSLAARSSPAAERSRCSRWSTGPTCTRPFSNG